MAFVGGKIGRLQNLFLLLLLIYPKGLLFVTIKTAPSVLSCCQDGLDLAKKEDPSAMAKSDKMESGLCTILNSGFDLINELSSKNRTNTPSSDQCNLLKESCYLATKTNKFCHDATLVSQSKLIAGQPFAEKEITRDLFFTSKSCCLAHDKLPSVTAWSNRELELNAAGIPVCCFAENYKDYIGPDGQIRFASTDISGSSKEHQMESSTVTTESLTLKPLTEQISTDEMQSDAALNEEEDGDNLTTSSLIEKANSMTTVGIHREEAEDERQSNTRPPSQQPENPMKDERQSSAGNESEIVCEEGFIWYPDKRLCIQTRSKCPRGMYMSVRQKMCIPKDNLPFKCPPGYEYKDDTGDCQDIDECKFNRTICRRGYKCRNILGSYQCIRQVPCGFGYILNPETQDCEDIDECKMDPDVCGPNMLCVNVRGGMRCMTKKCPGKQRRDSSGNCVPCPSGYEFNDKLSSCDDINECALNQTLCRPFEKCVNRPGDFICEPKLRCKWGMQINANGTACEDVDECSAQTFNCQHHEICVNTVGSYYCAPSPCHYTEVWDYEKHMCTCPHGYRHKNGECIDIDECAEDVAGVTNLNPLCKDGKTCVNTPGGYRCVTLTGCPAGFKRNSIREPCMDIDECATGIAKCGLNMHCENTIGSYRCLCQRGYKNVNDTACVDIDECKVFSSIESCADPRARCVNTAGSYKCICPNGFVWHSYPVYACKDVNECVITPDICGHGHKCVNEEGGYRCECANGFRTGMDNRTCVDVNECSESSGGCKDGICVNTPGGFRCDCPSGYRLSDQHQCVDINECQEKEDICEPRQARGLMVFKCLNLQGDYRCISEHCPKMYRLEKMQSGFRCHLKPEHACRAYDHGCLRDRPLLIENYHIELVAPMKHEQLLAEVDSSIIVNGTVRAELRVHYAYQMRSNLHMSTEDAFKLRLKSPDSRFVDVVLLRPLEAPADLLISANLFAVRGRMRALKSVTKLYIFTTETAQQQAAFERQQHRLLRGRGY